MGSLDFFSPSTLGYPGAAQGSQGQGSPCGLPYAQPEPDGFFNKIFGPKSLAYPMPPCQTLGTVNYKSLDEELARQRQQLLPDAIQHAGDGADDRHADAAGGRLGRARIAATPAPSSPAPAASVLQPTPVPAPYRACGSCRGGVGSRGHDPGCAHARPRRSSCRPTPAPSAAPVASSEASSIGARVGAECSRSRRP